MTFEEFETVCLDIFTEYLPKSVDKVTKKRVIGELARELQDQGALDLVDLEDLDETDTDDGDKPEDLVSLFGD
jgi:hypothetical protein